MVDLLGPADAGSSPTLTTTTDVTAPVAGDTWYEDCSTPTANDGSPIPAKWLNRVMQQMRAAIRSSNVPLSNAYDEMLSWAMQSGYVNWVPNFTGSANALVGSAPNNPQAIEGGTVVCGIIMTATNTGAVTFNWAGLGAQPVKRLDGTACTGGELVTNSFLVMRWDGGAWRIVSPLPGSFYQSGSASIQVNQQVFNVGGDYTWTILANFANCSSLLLELWGAGCGTVIGAGGTGGNYARFETYLGFFVNNGSPSGFTGGSVSVQVGIGGVASNNTTQNIQGGWSIFDVGGFNNFFAASCGSVTAVGTSASIGPPQAPPGQATPVSNWLKIFEPGGAPANPAGFAVVGAPTVFSGAGGASWNGVDGTPWTSVVGGNGGANAMPGAVPGGGGGGGRSGGSPSPTVGGPGGDGQVRITVIGPYQP